MSKLIPEGHFVPPPPTAMSLIPSGPQRALSYPNPTILVVPHASKADLQVTVCVEDLACIPKSKQNVLKFIQ